MHAAELILDLLFHLLESLQAITEPLFACANRNLHLLLGVLELLCIRTDTQVQNPRPQTLNPKPSKAVVTALYQTENKAVVTASCLP